MKRNIVLIAPAGLVFAAHGAAAFELDSLLPSGIPGFASSQSGVVLTRAATDAPVGLQAGGLAVQPDVSLGPGYDSAPNGSATGSPLFSLNADILASDDALGFGAYAASNNEFVTAVPSQNSDGYAFAVGERAVLPADVVSVSIAQLRMQETGFALNTVSLVKPVSVIASQFRVSDAHGFGMVTMTPEFAVSRAVFGALPEQSHTNYDETVNFADAPGGPVTAVARVHADQSRYEGVGFDAATYEGLAGLQDSAPALWDVRALGGVATRRPASGKAITAPVLEGALDWMPTDLDSLSFSVAREIDDPMQESANGYTLDEGRFTLAHEYLRNVVITASALAQNAAYFQSKRAETVLSTDAALTWRASRAVAITADYSFNDRQSNFLPAANEHIATVRIDWTP